MLSNLGLLLLCFSFSVSVAAFVQIAVNGRMAAFNVAWSFAVTRLWVWISFLAVSASLALLAYSFYSNDFTNAYVSAHSNSHLPSYFRLAAVWGGHEGSMLFWVWVVHLWAAIISLQQKKQLDYLKPTLQLMLTVGGVLSLFVIAFSNPFTLNESWVVEGRDLNPMLQDVALIIHPPLLYVGYVGFSAPFAAACVAVWKGSINDQWFGLIRSWVLVSWAFLTAGIALGAWWAYYELGWGGWWFWDPVENASLLPWLAATALLHGVIRVKGSTVFPVTVLALSFVTFSLSLLGTFIVRSGVLTSVHAFAVDPSKGIVLIALSVFVLLIGVIPLILKSGHFIRRSETNWRALPIFLLTSIGLLSIATAVVMLGTFYPMIFQVLGLGSISVGAPYFNALFSLLCTAGLIGLCIHLLRGYSLRMRAGLALACALLSLLMSLLVLKVNADASMLLTVLALSCAILLTLQLFTHRNWVSYMAHLAVVLLIVGSVTYEDSSYQVNRKLQVGEQVDLRDYSLMFVNKSWLVGPNYTALEGQFELTDLESDRSYILLPQKRHYQVRVMNMSEPAIRSLWHGDLYLSLGNKLADGSYIIKFQYKAGMSLIWLSALLLVLAAVLRLISFTPFLTHRYSDNEKANSATARHI
jgi:cytochrome c-type biogenesis protein CcmF